MHVFCVVAVVHFSHMSFSGNVAPRLETVPPEVLAEQERAVQAAAEEEARYREEERAALEAQIKKEQADSGPANDNAFLEAAVPVAASESVVVKDPFLVSIEQILEKDLAEEFKKDLNDAQKTRFTHDGILLAERIFAERVKIAAHKRQPGTVVRWIRHWLLELPGMSKVFLDQLAKNKTDAVLKALQTNPSSTP